METLSEGFWIESWFVDPRGNSLTDGDNHVRVEPKVMGVLECLAERPGKTVTKSTFMDRVWEGTVVTDDVLARCVSQIRKVFDDDPRHPRIIETIRKRGYRLIAPIRLPSVEPEIGPAEQGSHPPLGLSHADHPSPAAPPTNGQGHTNGVAPTEHDAGEPSGFHRLLAPLLRRPKETIATLLFALLVVSVLAILGSRSDAVPPPKTIPFTSFPGEEIDPAISPDGEQLAFARIANEGRNHDLFIKQTGAETPFQLTDDPAIERSPTWSPDGRQIAFVRTMDGQTSILTMPVIGGNVRPLMDLGAIDVRSLVWSPNGDKLALSAQSTPNDSYRILLLHLDSLRIRAITDPPASSRGDVDLAFSPNGNQIAFIRSIVEGNEDVYLVDLPNGPARPLTSDHAELSGLDWTSDGKSIVFASNREGTSSLWRIPVTGGVPNWIATASEGGRLQQPSIARHAARLTYAERMLDTNIWQVRRTGDRLRRLISSTRWDSHPQLSPDESSVAFASRRSGGHEIWACDRDGSNPRQLTFFENGQAGTPRWSPDSRHIVFEARPKGTADIYIIDDGSSAPRQLTYHERDDVAPSWSRDTSAVYFASNRGGDWQIWKIAAQGGEDAMQVTRNGGIAAFDSPDGSSLFIVKGDTTGIWELSLIDLQERQIVPDLQPFDWGNWAVTEGGIYYLRRLDGATDVAFYSFASGKIWSVLQLQEVPEHPGFSVSSDGEWLIYTQIDRSESDILLVKDFH